MGVATGAADQMNLINVLLPRLVTHMLSVASMASWVEFAWLKSNSQRHWITKSHCHPTQPS
jgi:hypothetical protein